MAQKCIFCGGTPLTNAHIFRQGWIDQIFPGADSFSHRHTRRGSGGFDRPWTTSRADLKVKSVCQRCNGGWMDRLDHDAERLFATQAVAIGSMIRLDRQADVAVVARWCVLIAALVDQAQKKPTLTAETHTALYNGTLPRTVGIWTFRTEPPEWTATGWADPREWIWNRERAGGLTHTYFVTFGVKHLVVQVHIAEGLPEGVELGAEGGAAISRQLWPPPLTPFIWPPPQTVPWDQIEKLTDVLAPPPEAS